MKLEESKKYLEIMTKTFDIKCPNINERNINRLKVEAIETVLQALDKKEKLKQRCKELIKEKQQLTTSLEDSISKDKVKEKIEELNKNIDLSIDNSKGGLDEDFINKGTKLLAQKRILKELLEDK